MDDISNFGNWKIFTKKGCINFFHHSLILKKENYLTFKLACTLPFWKKKRELFEIFSQCTIPNTIFSHSKQLFILEKKILHITPSYSQNKKTLSFEIKKNFLFENGYAIQKKMFLVKLCQQTFLQGNVNMRNGTHDITELELQ